MGSNNVLKRAKRFVNQVADKLKETGLSTDSHEKAFRNAVQDLPQGELKAELTINLSSYVEQFLSSDYVSSTVAKQRPANPFSATGFKVDEKTILLLNQSPDHLRYSCFLMEKVKMQVDFERDLKHCQDVDYTVEGDVWLKDVHMLCSMLIYDCQAAATLQKTMRIFHKHLLNSVEACILQRQSQRLERLQTESLQFLYFSQFVHDQLNKAQHSFHRPSYGECVSAILAVYFDMLVTLNQSGDAKNAAGVRYVGVVMYLLHGRSEDVLDLMLPDATLSLDAAPDTFQTAVAKDIFFPLAHRALNLPVPGTVSTEPALYSKYVAAVHHMQMLYPVKLGSETQRALGVAAPGEFLTWLEERGGGDPAVIDDLPVTKKFHGAAITRFLLTEAAEKTIAALLDILACDFMEEEKIPDEATLSLSSSSPSMPSSSDTQLYFIDTGLKSAKQLKKDLGLSKQQLSADDEEEEEEDDDAATMDDDNLELELSELEEQEMEVESHSEGGPELAASQANGTVNDVVETDTDDAVIVCITPAKRDGCEAPLPIWKLDTTPEEKAHRDVENVDIDTLPPTKKAKIDEGSKTDAVVLTSDNSTPKSTPKAKPSTSKPNVSSPATASIVSPRRTRGRKSAAATPASQTEKSSTPESEMEVVEAAESKVMPRTPATATTTTKDSDVQQAPTNVTRSRCPSASSDAESLSARVKRTPKDVVKTPKQSESGSDSVETPSQRKRTRKTSENSVDSPETRGTPKLAETNLTGSTKRSRGRQPKSIVEEVGQSLEASNEQSNPETLPSEPSPETSPRNGRRSSLVVAGAGRVVEEMQESPRRSNRKSLGNEGAASVGRQSRRKSVAGRNEEEAVGTPTPVKSSSKSPARKAQEPTPIKSSKSPAEKVNDLTPVMSSSKSPKKVQEPTPVKSSKSPARKAQEPTPVKSSMSPKKVQEPTPVKSSSISPARKAQEPTPVKSSKSPTKKANEPTLEEMTPSKRNLRSGCSNS